MFKKYMILLAVLLKMSTVVGMEADVPDGADQATLEAISRMCEIRMREKRAQQEIGRRAQRKLKGKEEDERISNMRLRNAAEKVQEEREQFEQNTDVVCNCVIL